MADGAPVLPLQATAQKIVAVDADLSGSEFVDVALRSASFRKADFTGAAFADVRMEKVSIDDANLTGCTITRSRVDGMTIDGVGVDALFAAWRSVRPG